jgi:hypothetical protein
MPHVAGQILNDSDTEAVALDGFKLWKRVDDSGYFECLYRLIEDDQIEVLALGARVVVPIKALALLTEPIARAVLTELAERAANELGAAAKVSTP